MILELIIAGGAALIGGKVGHFFGKRKKKVVRPNDGSIAYNWRQYSTTGGKVWGFACPKCPRIQSGNQQKFCECAEYFEGHFHFGCSACGFKAIMRSKDAG